MPNIGPDEPLTVARFPVASQAETACQGRPSGWDFRSRLAGDPATVQAFIQSQQLEIDGLSVQLTALADRVGEPARADRPQLAPLLQTALKRWPRSPLRGSPSGYKPPERRMGRGRLRGGQSGPPGSGPEPLPIERVDEVVEHHPDACRHCGTLLDGEDPDPLRHQVIEFPPFTPLVIEQWLHRLGCLAVPPAPAQRCQRLGQPVRTAPGSVLWWACWAVPFR